MTSFNFIMPTDRELREISKKVVAKKREKKAEIKELKEKGLCTCEGRLNSSDGGKETWWAEKTEHA